MHASGYHHNVVAVAVVVAAIILGVDYLYFENNSFPLGGRHPTQQVIKIAEGDERPHCNCDQQ